MTEIILILVCLPAFSVRRLLRLLLSEIFVFKVTSGNFRLTASQSLNLMMVYGDAARPIVISNASFPETFLSIASPTARILNIIICRHRYLQILLMSRTTFFTMRRTYRPVSRLSNLLRKMLMTRHRVWPYFKTQLVPILSTFLIIRSRFPKSTSSCRKEQRSF